MKGQGKGWRVNVTHCPAGHLYTGVRRNARRNRHGKVYTMRYCVFCDRARKCNGKGLTWRRREMQCPKGHSYAGSNLGIATVKEHGRERETRLCLECRRQRCRRYKARLAMLDRAATHPTAEGRA